MEILLVILWLAAGWLGAAAFWADVQRPEWLWMSEPEDVVVGLCMVLMGLPGLIVGVFCSDFFAHGLKFIPHWSPPK